jgi:manganese-dependent inorganic pyrophosphatase
MNTALVTAYVNPDLDGVAGAIGYAEFLNKTGFVCEAGFIGQIHDEVKYIIDRFGFSFPKLIANTDDYEQICLVDASDLNGLGGKILPEKVIDIIDHRQIHEANKFPNAKVQIELVGAAATLVAEKFIQNNLKISKESATLIFSAIVSNTLNFKGTVTTDRDKKAAAWVNQTANLTDSFWKDLFTAKSDLSGEKLLERVKGDFAHFIFGNKKIGIAQIEMIGAKKLVESRGEEIIKILKQIKTELKLDFIFQNTIELEETKNFFITDDASTKIMLEKILNLKFLGDIAERPNLIMRKQIVPLIKEELEKTDNNL